MLVIFKQRHLNIAHVIKYVYAKMCKNTTMKNKYILSKGPLMNDIQLAVYKNIKTAKKRKKYVSEYTYISPTEIRYLYFHDTHVS